MAALSSLTVESSVVDVNVNVPEETRVFRYPTKVLVQFRQRMKAKARTIQILWVVIQCHEASVHRLPW
jgi:hypothetical protein